MDNNNNIFDQFDLPHDYFNRSKTSIFNKIEWQNEHEQYPTLLKFKGSNGFVVPQDYFHSNQHKFELIDHPVLSSIKKQNAFETPNNYFEEQGKLLEQRFELESELELHTNLSAIEKVLPYTVTDEYFKESKTRLTQLEPSRGGAKIISLNRKPYWYAAAAVLTIAFSLWIYNAYFSQTEVIDGDCNTLACIEKRELLKYKLENLENDELYELVNSKQLEERLNKKEITDTLKTTDSIDASVLDYIE
ncbi:MAG: hypothetical protein ACK50A_01715 [Sphingobacteriaceae bacterium]